MSVNILEVDLLTGDCHWAGFAIDAKSALELAHPSLRSNKEIFQRKAVKEYLLRIDNGHKELFLNKPEEGKPVFFSDTKEGLLEEVSQWNSLQGPCNRS